MISNNKVSSATGYGFSSGSVDSTPYSQLVSEMKETFETGVSRDVQWRLDQIDRFISMFENHREEWAEVQQKDLAQTEPLKTTEVLMSLSSAKYLRSNLTRLMASESIPITAAANLPSEGYIEKEPVGVVLIISPWNYPISLLALPLVGALAAGNLVIVKPSEVSENVSALFSKLIEKYFDPKYVRCIEGDATVTTNLLKEPYDHIFYTGSVRVGKVVMKAAAEHLTPVTLGKCDCETF